MSTNNKIIEIGHGSYGTVYLDKSLNKVYKSFSLICRENNCITFIDTNLRELVFYKTIKYSTKYFTKHYTYSSIYNLNIPLYEKILINKSNFNVSIYMDYYGVSLNNTTKINIYIFCKDILSQIYSLHMSNISHGDIKMNNILYNSENDKYTLIDYGTVSFMNPSKEMLFYRSTLLYSSPEELDSIIYNTTSDVWSFGMILYEVYSKENLLVYILKKLKLEGIIPFLYKRTQEYHYKKINEVYNSIDQQYINDIIHENVKDTFYEQILKKCLVKDPSQRSKVKELCKDFSIDKLHRIKINSSPILFYKDVEKNTYVESRNICIDIMYDICCKEVIGYPNIFVSSVMCFDRFLSKITVDLNINIYLASIMIVCINHMIYNFELIRNIEIKSEYNWIKKKYSINSTVRSSDILHTFYVLIKIMEFLFYNKTFESVLIERNINIDINSLCDTCKKCILLNSNVIAVTEYYIETYINKN